MDPAGSCDSVGRVLFCGPGRLVGLQNKTRPTIQRQTRYAVNVNVSPDNVAGNCVSARLAGPLAT